MEGGGSSVGKKGARLGKEARVDPLWREEGCSAGEEGKS